MFRINTLDKLTLNGDHIISCKSCNNKMRSRYNIEFLVKGNYILTGNFGLKPEEIEELKIDPEKLTRFVESILINRGYTGPLEEEEIGKFYCLYEVKDGLCCNCAGNHVKMSTSSIKVLLKYLSNNTNELNKSINKVNEYYC